MAHPLTTVGTFNYDTLNKELQLNANEEKVLKVFLEAYLDDFWQAGKGSLLPPSHGSNSSLVDSLFEKRFVFRNILRECVMRVSGAFFGKAPNWKFQVNGEVIERPRGPIETTAPSPEVEGQATPTDLTEIDKALSAFWTRQNVAEAMSKAFESRLAFGRGGIRIFIPTKFKRQNLVKPSDTPNVEQDPNPVDAPEQFVAFPDIPSAIRAMRVEFVPPTQSKLLDDEGEFFSLVKYSVRKDWTTNEEIGVIEFSFVDNSEMTFVGTVEERGNTSRLEDVKTLSSAFDLAGWPTYSEFKGSPYVTAGLYKNNQLANLALTCAGFSLVDNGFGEMVLTNVELETERIATADGESIEVPKRIRRGGGAVQNFVGISQFDEQTGQETRATPGVTFRDAGSMSPFKDGYNLAYAACLSEATQLYALISGDATASGESRIQALADFLLRIMPYKSEVDEQGSWLMTVVFLWAGMLSNVQLQGYSIAFDSRVHVANLSGAEKTTVMAMRKDGAISRETERVLLGIDDPALEAELVQKEQSVPPEQTTVEEFSEKLDVGLKMLGIGIDLTTIQQFLGYTPEQMIAMQQAAADAQAELLANIEAQNAAASGQVPPQDQTAAQGA